VTGWLFTVTVTVVPALSPDGAVVTVVVVASFCARAACCGAIAAPASIKIAPAANLVYCVVIVFFIISFALRQHVGHQFGVGTPIRY
jgi:hypothetical protein